MLGRDHPMLVYGDPSFPEPLDRLADRLRERLRAAERAACAGPVPLDLLRTLLIEAGQAEQATQDSPTGNEARQGGADPFPEITDFIARAFVSARRRGDNRSDLDGGASDIVPALRDAGRLLDLHDLQGDRPVRVKVPEGFAFYTLYPEQYAAAADAWLRQNEQVAGAGRAVVVGVRSIGTSLSAVVAAVLARAGWEVTRVTVRPTGDPYVRRAALSPGALPPDAHGLVVDEGPGHSGSSMAAAGQALVVAGIDRGRVSFLPGHPGPPGHAAGDAVRAWWDATPRHVVAPDDLRWGGLSLRDTLARRAAELCGRPVERVDDLGGGAWRRHVFGDPAQWPAACGPFERAKYLCVLAGGGGVLWKFAGLAPGPDGRTGADATAARLDALAAGGWTAGPLGVTLGFLAARWVEGRPLHRTDASPDVLAHLGRYIAAASTSTPPITRDEQQSAFDRLAEMLYWNTRKSLGEADGDRARQLADAARDAIAHADVPAYGDGRLAPHEWLRTSDGRLLKTDCVGHDADHTLVGRQPVAWDVAGAMVEWGLDDATAHLLLDAFRAGRGAETPARVLPFHLAAYAAFRVGMCSTCADMSGHDPGEQARLHAAASGYAAQLSARLRDHASVK